MRDWCGANRKAPGVAVDALCSKAGALVNLSGYQSPEKREGIAAMEGIGKGLWSTRHEMGVQVRCWQRVTNVECNGA